MKTLKARSSALGFSLLEILIAMVIVSVALLGILALQTASVRSAAGGRGRETAVYACQTLLDDVQTEAQRLSLEAAYSTTVLQAPTPTRYFAADITGTRYFDVNGRDTGDANAVDNVFTVNWRRQAPRDGAPNCFEFSATATWRFETNAQNVPVERTVQINRLVRRDVVIP